MHSSKPIDISKSSLVGLRAELLKKQEEVRKLKQLGVQHDGAKQISFKDKKKKNLKRRETPTNPASSSIVAVEVDDFDDLKKSREVLEAKARLYDKLKNNCTSAGEVKNQYLIDFELKEKLAQCDKKLEKPEECAKPSEDEDDYESDVNSDPENDWVDFVDTLGRSRRCLRRDLPAMKAKDSRLATTLHPPSPPPPAGETTPSQAVDPSPELLSWDMQREMMRRKWEEQEMKLLDKKDIHYQDVLFDEARPHGVGYFDFSVDEVERQRQQEALLRLRKETEEQQAAAAGLRARRKQQLDARLAAARKRKRQRLGLPEEEEEPPEEAQSILPQEEPPKEETVEELKESLKKIAPVRPWDVGKDGVKPVMSQEEWVEMKREERPAEFAPPATLAAVIETEEEDENQKHNFFTTKKKNTFSQRTGLFNSQKYTGKSIPSALESYKANYCKPSNEEDHSRTQNNEDGECIGPTLAEMTVRPPSTEPTYTSAENKSRDVLWKPTVADIDNLLSQAKENSSKDKISSLNEFGNHPNSQKEFYCNGFPDNSMGFREEQNPQMATSDKLGTETKPNPMQRIMSSYKNSDPTCISMIKNEVDPDYSFEESSNQNKSREKALSKRKYAEIAPPPSMSYYINEINTTQTASTSKVNKEEVANSISAGMSYLKSKTSEKESKRVKGLLDIV